jgi:mannose-6-phosphate isomerase-like protein (cupin superfamily)
VQIGNVCFIGIRAAALLATAALLEGADPTFLRRSTGDIQPQASDLTENAKNAFYRPFFGAGDKDARQLKGVARYGELTVESGGSSAMVSYPAEEQIYYILDGHGTLLYDDQKIPVKADDFMYLPVSVKHGMAAASDSSVRLLVMGWRIPRGVTVAPTAKPMIANSADVQLQQVGGHGPTSLFKLLIGTTESKRDKLAAANQMVSLFIMDFAPGGTNIPHHHDMEEEIYYVLRGHGEMVAGGGADGNEGRHPTKTGEAFFIRLNTTVGYYSGSKEGEPHDLILAVRSRYPFPQRRE